MKNKRVEFLFSFSLIAIGISTVLLLVPGLFGFELPDALTRALGIIALCSIPILIYAVIRKWRSAR